MKNLVCKLLLFGIGVVLISLGVSASCRLIDPNYRDYPRKIETLLARSEQVEALAVGCSHNMALDFATLELRGYHIWQANGDLFEVKYQLHNLVPRLPHLKTVFLPVPYFAFTWDNAACRITDRAYIRREMYAGIPAWNYIEGDFRQFVQGKMSPVDDWRQAVIRLLKSYKDFRPDNYGKPVLLRPSRFTDAAMLEAYTVTTGIPNQILLQRDMLKNNPRLVEQTLETLLAIDDFLDERNIRLVLYTPPYFHAYNTHYAADIIGHMRSNLEKIRGLRGTEYYDFSADPEVVRNLEFFSDDNHLSESGARFFSSKLKSKLATADMAKTDERNR